MNAFTCDEVFSKKSQEAQNSSRAVSNCSCLKKSSYPNNQPSKTAAIPVSSQLNYLLKSIFQNALSKLLSQTFIVFIALIYSSSESLEEIYKSTITCLITFFGILALF